MCGVAGRRRRTEGRQDESISCEVFLLRAAGGSRDVSGRSASDGGFGCV
jgi:hypothetical protein